MTAADAAGRVLAEAERIARDAVEREHESLLDVLDTAQRRHAEQLQRVACAAQNALTALCRAVAEYEAARAGIAARVAALGLLAAPHPDGGAWDTATDGRDLTLRGTHWAPLDPADIVRKTAEVMIKEECEP